MLSTTDEPPNMDSNRTSPSTAIHTESRKVNSFQGRGKKSSSNLVGGGRGYNIRCSSLSLLLLLLALLLLLLLLALLLLLLLLLLIVVFLFGGSSSSICEAGISHESIFLSNNSIAAIESCKLNDESLQSMGFVYDREAAHASTRLVISIIIISSVLLVLVVRDNTTFGLLLLLLLLLSSSPAPALPPPPLLLLLVLLDVVVMVVCECVSVPASGREAVAPKINNTGNCKCKPLSLKPKNERLQTPLLLLVPIGSTVQNELTSSSS